MNVLKGIRPDITPAQVVAIAIAAVYPLLVLFGVSLDPDQKDALDNLTALAGLLILGDAGLRIGRNIAAGKTMDPAAQPPLDPDLIDGGDDLDVPLTEEEQIEARELENSSETPQA